MQILFILGIVFAIAAVTFALQNNAAATVAFGPWHFDSSLAVVLLVAMAIGALVTGLVSTPRMIRAQWEGARLRRQVAKLEEDRAILDRRVIELEAQLPATTLAAQAPVPEKPYVGLKTLLSGREDA